MMIKLKIYLTWILSFELIHHIMDYTVLSYNVTSGFLCFPTVDVGCSSHSRYSMHSVEIVPL